MDYKTRMLKLQNINVESWLVEGDTKVTLAEVCAKLDVDIDTDLRNKRFYNIGMTRKAVIDETMSEYLGFKGSTTGVHTRP